MDSVAGHVAACRQHVVRRAQERFGLELSAADVLSLERRIEAGEGAYVGYTGDRAVTYKLIHQGRPLYVVYCLEKSCCVTLLAGGQANYNGRSRGHGR